MQYRKSYVSIFEESIKMKVNSETTLYDILDAAGIPYETVRRDDFAITQAGDCDLYFTGNRMTKRLTKVVFSFGITGEVTRKFVNIVGGEIDLTNLKEKYNIMVKLYKEYKLK